MKCGLGVWYPTGVEVLKKAIYPDHDVVEEASPI